MNTTAQLTSGISAPSQITANVCAVVVTYNRKDLLRECLRALIGQTQHVSRALVINNVSTDGTSEMMAQEFPHIEVITLPRNSGGAGGFHEGVKEAAAGQTEWVWLMDDDTIPQPDALEQLLRARERFTEDKPDLLASKVVWTDGALHSMNVMWVDQRNPENLFRAAAAGTLALRTATFVSLLIHRRHVEQFGLPIFDYFIWGDDVEYSGRILRTNFGVAVPASVATHKTPRNHRTTDASPRFYYHVRNSIWMLTRSSAFTGRERLRMAIGLIQTLPRYVCVCSLKVSALGVIARGVRDGLFRSPLR